jgi:hypothetical protein
MQNESARTYRLPRPKMKTSNAMIARPTVSVSKPDLCRELIQVLLDAADHVLRHATLPAHGK